MKKLVPIWCVLVVELAICRGVSAEPRAKEAPVFTIEYLELRNTTIRDCIVRVAEADRELHAEGLGLQLVVKLSPEKARKRVSARLEKVTACDAMRIICALGGLKCRLDGQAFVIAEVLPDHAAFDKEVAKHRGTAVLQTLRELHFPSTLPYGGVSLLQAVGALTLHSQICDPAG